ncbi:hypothetical protein [Candidatus Poriferisodalis sp.]|uniref:hypothetical protein n=1 Tax=Candidatus Poriferisodalis sp. TaxID=3101277 RepID=UPI003B019C3F
MAGDAGTGAGSGRPAVSPSGGGVSAVAETPGAVSAGAGVERRSPLVPVLVAVTVALIGGVFVFASAGFNALRDDMNRGFAQMDSRFTQVDARFTQIDDRFAQVDARFAQIDDRLADINEILLDHTDRLARLEAVQNTHTHR